MKMSTSKTSRKSEKQLVKSSKDRIHYVHPYVFSEIHPLNISIAGCGGTGGMILRDLARMHTSLKALGLPGLHVSAYDPDIFTEANYGRQLMSEDDIGEPKAIAMIERINRAYGLQWNGYKKKFKMHSPNTGHNPTILITAVDSVEERKKCVSGFWINKTDNIGGWLYHIDAGNGLDFGQVIIGTSKKIKQPESKLYQTVDFLSSPLEIYNDHVSQPNEPSCSIAQALGRQDLMINSMMSQLVCEIIWKMVKYKYLTLRGVYLNLETMTMKPVKI